jgi:hypothetical protein
MTLIISSHSRKTIDFQERRAREVKREKKERKDRKERKYRKSTRSRKRSMWQSSIKSLLWTPNHKISK